MKLFSTGKCRAAFLSTAMLFGLTAASHAALSYTVTLNVSSLIGNTNAPFSLDLEMTVGSGNASNSVTISNFQVTGGSFTGSPFVMGGATGSFDDTLTLDNSSANNIFAQDFTAGTTTISFLVTQTTNSEFVPTGTPIPDQFNIFIDDLNTADGFVPTTDPSGGNALLSSTISDGETVQDINSYSSISPDGGVTVSVVPEPTSALMLLLGGMGFFVRRRRA